MNITTIGFDIAKNVFQVHGANERGKPGLDRRLKRGQVLEFFAQQNPCLVGIEACGGAHHWARKLASFGHTVKLMAPQFVKPYVKSNKNDSADAAAICEAVRRPTMRFVPIKNVEQQAILSVHRARQGFITARTAVVNEMRGLLIEFGIVIPQGIRNVAPHLAGILEDAANDLPTLFRSLLHRLSEHYKELDRQVLELEHEIKIWHRESENSRKIAEIPGIGPLTASALVASISDAREFKSGRQMAAWLGLVPRQNSSGGKEKLLGISKRGDSYLRMLLIHGARAVLRHLGEKKDATSLWLRELSKRRHPNVVTVALANKNARIVWALLVRGTRFEARAGSLAVA
jgi:transposase